MEVELKYLVDSKERADAIFNDAYLFSIEEEDTREKTFFKAAYFDTADYILSKHDIAFRVRMEGDQLVAALKWRGKVEGGLHRREEINVPLDDPQSYIMPSPEIFAESDIGKEVIRLVGESPLISLMEMGFLRSRFRVDTGNSIIEVALDMGEILTDRGNLPILELELELYSGEETELMALGDRLSKAYELLPFDQSKYLRGRKLLGIEKEGQ
jgi:inorganic triphosphatase YgiF